MPKSVESLCPENNTFSDESKLSISDQKQQAVNWTRTPVLNPDLRWIGVRQKNTGTDVEIDDGGTKRLVTSHRFWFVGLDEQGVAKSVRTVAISSFRQMALGKVIEGIAAPKVAFTVNEKGAVRTAPGTPYIHAMSDTSWIKGVDNRYVIDTPVAIAPSGTDTVYQAKFKDGVMQTDGEYIELTTTSMKYFTLLNKPTEQELATAKEALENDPQAAEHFYAL